MFEQYRKPIKSILAGRTMVRYSIEEYEKYIDAICIESVGHLIGYEDPKAFQEALLRIIKEFQ